MISTLVSSKDEKLMAIADVYLSTYDIEDLRENIMILLRVSFGGSNNQNIRKSSAQTSFEEMLKIMEKEGEITGLEKGKLNYLYRNNDDRVLAINENYRHDHDEIEFRESIQLIATAISLNIQEMKISAKKKSHQKSRNSRGMGGGIIDPHTMSSMSEEYEEEEEEEEEEEDIYNSLNSNDDQDLNVNDENVKNTFIEQQHRIIKRFCLNAKIPVADGAKFHQMIKEYNPKIISSFEVFALNRSEEDFLENLMVIAEVMKSPAENDSPDGKSMSPLNSFSGNKDNEEEEEEKKLFDLEPMEKESDTEEGEYDEEEEKDYNENNGFSHPKVSMTIPYTINEIQGFSEILEELKDSFSETELDTFKNLFKNQNGEISTCLNSQAKTIIVSAIESYQHSKDKEELEDTLKLFLEMTKR